WDAEALKVAEKQGVFNNAQSAVDRLAKFAPGGSVRFTAASARSVSMDEDFDPPLIIGYPGFGIAIRPLGQLRPPLPTHAHIDPASGLSLPAGSLAVRASFEPSALESLDSIVKRDARKKLPGAVALDEQMDRLARRIPEERVRLDQVPKQSDPSVFRI